MRIRQLFFNYAAAGILISGVAGCLGAESGQKQITDPGKISQIQKGVSTKASIRAAFGLPGGIEYASNGDEIWSYSYANVSVNPATFVPVIGIFAGGETSQSSALMVHFDTQGIVRSYGVHNGGAVAGEGKM